MATDGHVFAHLQYEIYVLQLFRVLPDCVSNEGKQSFGEENRSFSVCMADRQHPPLKLINVLFEEMLLLMPYTDGC